jgi:PIN domain nuclease of toxin-antitoxin system
MTEVVVLDTSAILAELWDEPGADTVRGVPPGAVVSAVNLAEVVSKLVDRGVSRETVRMFIDRLRYRIVDADKAQAVQVGLMREQTRRSGLSLGDRFCLVLAQGLDASAMTADRAWKDLDHGVEITLIR